jgi:uncharacterized protein YgbK (DUF1537 family)
VAIPVSGADVVATGQVTSAPRSFANLDQPPVAADPSEDRLDLIRQRNTEANAWTLVLDDDPTGTQTVRDAPVLTGDSSEEELDWASRHPARITFALTNSRSLDGATAEQLTFDIVTRAARVARRDGLRLRVVSRSDSTLRGHFAIEIAAVHRALRASGVPARGTVFAPAFLEAGRITALDVQWVSTPEGFVTAARTEFARDKTFGYDEEDLGDWVVARTGPSGGPGPATISLESLRSVNGIAEAAATLSSLTSDQVVIANAVRGDDLEVLMLGLLDREDAGQSLVIRSGPSFVRLCAAQPPSEPIGRSEVFHDQNSASSGLVVVGSHTDLTNGQVDHARENHELTVVELDAAQIIGGTTAEAVEVSRASAEVVLGLANSDVLLRTSREVLTEGRADPLRTSAAIADALVAVVQQVVAAATPRYLVAKGGITSSDMAVRALGVRRAVVRGQMLPGTIPLWELLDGAIPGLPYVVFPGNVGTDDALSQVLTKVKR